MPSYAENSVDVRRNDLTNTLGAIVNIPLALLLRGFTSIFPETGNQLAHSLPASAFGTGDHIGWKGALVGDNDGGKNPGILGLAMSLAHMELIWGDKKDFEDGQHAHNDKTGKGQKSESGKSIDMTFGEGVGILAKHLGVGTEFFGLMFHHLGPITDEYSFLAGIRDGALPERPK